MESDALCTSGSGLEDGEQGLWGNDGTSIGLGNSKVLGGLLVPGSWLWISFKVEIFRV